MITAVSNRVSKPAATSKIVALLLNDLSIGVDDGARASRL